MKFFDGLTLVGVVVAIFTGFKWIVERKDINVKNNIEFYDKLKERNLFSEQANTNLLEARIYSDAISYLKLFNKIEHREVIFNTNHQCYIDNLYLLSELSNKDLLEFKDNRFQITAKGKSLKYASKARKVLLGLFAFYIVLLSFFFAYLETISSLHNIITYVLCFCLVAIAEIPLINHLEKIKKIQYFQQHLNIINTI